MEREKSKNLSDNPFANASTKEQKDAVWLDLKSNAVRISKEKADQLIKAAIESQEK